MANEVATRGSTAVTMPPEKNAFEAYGDSGGTRILGTLLKFSKGEWLQGRDNLEMQEGLKLIAGCSHIEVGWVHWAEGRPVDVIMGKIGEGFVPPLRATLGLTNSLEWPRSEQDSDYGKPRDPWQKASGMPLVGQNGQVYSFVTGSRGGEGALKELAKTYGKRVRQYPDELPIVTLGMDSYRHPNKQFGKIWTPVFAIQGWTPGKRLEKALAKAEIEAHEGGEEEAPAAAEPENAYAAAKGKKQPKAAAKPTPKQEYAGEDDDIPF